MAPQSGRVVGRPSFFGKAGFIAVGAIFAAIGVHALNPREMYPLDPVKQDAFHICDQADPTFVRAVGTDREACYDRMPHVMAMAMGRIKPGGALTRWGLSRDWTRLVPGTAARARLGLASISPTASRR